MRSIFGPHAVNEEKKQCEGAYSTAQVIWGLGMNSATEIMWLPEPKVAALRDMAANAHFDHGCTQLELKEVQEFAGLLNLRPSQPPSSNQHSAPSSTCSPLPTHTVRWS